ncbi:MAG: LLM class flavin-dependent oxidoreductase [bacterium]|jgi:alkanesulfonate monooxygenase SsuD/methylene tetrahydromethanopterin reductase-like flavin-dependent oxidoreductase (luciferase family)|nr:LLM class flavin-dependent oxidoreductase [bacterium]
MGAVHTGELKVGVRLPLGATDVGEWLADASAYEAAGVDSLWLSEGLFRPADGGGAITPEPWTLLAALAAVTHRARLGTAVSVVATWPPALLAGVVNTLERLSRGRVVVGVGIGWEPAQLTAVGLEFSDRARRLDDHVRALRHLWSTPGEPFCGEFYDVPGLRLQEGVRPGGPPIFVGAFSEPGYRRAAHQGDGFVHGGGEPEQVRATLEHIDTLRAQAGRTGPFERWVQVGSPQDREEWQRILTAYAGAGATGIIVGAAPGLLDMLRNPDAEIDRSDLNLAQG